MLILETDRLLLRELTKADAEFVLTLTNDPKWLTHIGDRGINSLQDAEDFIEKGPIDSYQKNNFGMYAFCQKHASDPLASQPMGMCGLIQRAYLDKPDLGYATLANFRSNGYTLEACRGVLTLSRDLLGIEQVYGMVSPTNVASIKILEKLGFRFKEKRVIDELDSLIYLKL